MCRESRLGLIQSLEAPGHLCAYGLVLSQADERGVGFSQRGGGPWQTCDRAVSMSFGSQLCLPLAPESLGLHRMPSLLGTP